MRIRLTTDEFRYLQEGGFIKGEAQAQLARATPFDSGYTLDLPAVTADAIRDACGEQLQRVGFGADYEPTREGSLLEGMIDKFQRPHLHSTT